MSAKGEQLYRKWREKTPAQASLDDVDLVIGTFFTAQEARIGGKEPRVIEHRWLKALPGYTGALSIAAERGRAVKPVYVRKLVKAIHFIQWVKDHLDWPEDRDLPPEVGERYELEDH